MITAVSIDDIYSARTRIAGRVRHTPTVGSASLSQSVGSPVLLKLEQMQTTGSFKLRGATNAVLSLSDDQRAQGVVGASTGNHGRGLAYAAKQSGVRCVICMSALVPHNKIDGIRAHGADVRIVGKSQDDAQVEVERLVAEDGMVMLPPFDHADIIAGQGTLGLETVADVPDVETVLVPLSGGGLMSGVALAVKALRPNARLVGVSMERGAAMIESLQAGKPIMVEELPTLADSLGGGIGLDNQFTFSIVRDLVDEFVTVSETEIAEAIRHAYWSEQLIIEGSGSVGIAALLAGKVSNVGTCVALVTGRNIDMTLHKRLIDGENVDIAADQDREKAPTHA